MKNTKLIKVLQTLSKNEIGKFRDFVSSPYFNKNQNVIRVNEAILEHFPGFDTEQLTEENVFKKVFKDEKFDYFKIKNIISDLYQLSELYLQNISQKKKEIENEINLLNELHERKVENAFIKNEKQIRQQLSNVNVKDETYYLSEYLLAKINTAHFKFKSTGYTFNLIQNEFDTFLKFSLINLLRLYSKMLTNKNHGNVEFSLDMFDHVWAYVKDKDFENDPACQIYKCIISIELYKEEKDYKKLKELKVKYEENVSDEDIYYMLLVANSFCAYMLKLGDESYYKDRYLVFREMVERGISMKHYILFVNFMTTYTSAAMVGEFEWADKFMEEYSAGISPESEKDNTINYCLGFKAFRQKKYDSALEYFSKTNFKLYLMKVMVKSYTLRIFYEQEMYEQTFSAIDAFRHYLKGEELMADDQKLAHYEFLKHLTELTKLKSEGVKKNNSDLTVLKKEIKKMSSNPLGAKIWLMDKAVRF